MYHILFGKSNLTISLSVYDGDSESVYIVGIDDVLKRKYFLLQKDLHIRTHRIHLPYLRVLIHGIRSLYPNIHTGKVILIDARAIGNPHPDWFGIWPLIDVQFISSPLSVSRTHPTPLPSHLWPCMPCNRDGLTVEGEEHYWPHPTTGSRHR